MAARHGTRSKYNEGCRCDKCNLAESDYKKKRYLNDKGKKLGTVTKLTNAADEPVTQPPPMGPTELGVMAALEAAPALAAARPDLVASARAMARIQDNALHVAQQTNAAARMLDIMDRLLKGTQKKRKLAAVRNMPNPATG